MIRRTAWLLFIVLMVVAIVRVDVTAAGLTDDPTKPPPPPTPTPVPPTKPPPPPTPTPKPIKPTAPPTPTPESPTKPPAPPTPTLEPIKPPASPTPTSEPIKPPAPPTPTPEPIKSPAPPTPTPEPVKPPAPPTPTPTSTPKPEVSPTPMPTATPAPVLVQGRIFDDRNQDGALGSDEPGVAGVAILVDDEVTTVTDEDGHFSVTVPGHGRALLSIIAPEGWEWSGDALSVDELLATGGIAIALRRVGPAAAAPAVSPVVTSVLLVVLAAVAAGLALNGFSGLLQTASVRLLERTYRRHKSLELEQLQAQVVAQRRAEVKELLAQPDGWRKVIDQLLADALPEAGARVGPEGVLNISTIPAPRFTVVGADGHTTYLFTTSPEALRRVKILRKGLRRREKVIPLDASLHPAARVEAQAVWEHLAEQRLRQEGILVLPRQAEWFLVARQQPEQGKAEK